MPELSGRQRGRQGATYRAARRSSSTSSTKSPSSRNVEAKDEFDLDLAMVTLLELQRLPRAELQQLAKHAGIRANAASAALVLALDKHFHQTLPLPSSPPAPSVAENTTSAHEPTALANLLTTVTQLESDLALTRQELAAIRAEFAAFTVDLRPRLAALEADRSNTFLPLCAPPLPSTSTTLVQGVAPRHILVSSSVPPSPVANDDAPPTNSLVHSSSPVVPPSTSRLFSPLRAVPVVRTVNPSPRKGVTTLTFAPLPPRSLVLPVPSSSSKRQRTSDISEPSPSLNTPVLSRNRLSPTKAAGTDEPSRKRSRMEDVGSSFYSEMGDSTIGSVGGGERGMILGARDSIVRTKSGNEAPAPSPHPTSFFSSSVSSSSLVQRAAQSNSPRKSLPLASLPYPLISLPPSNPKPLADASNSPLPPPHSTLKFLPSPLRPSSSSLFLQKAPPTPLAAETLWGTERASLRFGDQGVDSPTVVSAGEGGRVSPFKARLGGAGWRGFGAV